MKGFTTPPVLTPNPNPRAPLAAVLSIATEEPVSGVIEIFDGKRTRRIAVPPSDDLRRDLAVAGMRPGKGNKIGLCLETARGARCEPVEFHYTPPMPPRSYVNLPPITVKTSKSGLMEPGFMVLSVRRRPAQRAIWWTEKQFRFANRWSMLIAIDEDGEIVWYYENDSRIAGIDQLENGNLFFNQVNFQSTEIDLLGNVAGSWYAKNRPFGPAPGAIPIEAQSMHHQPHMMPNGNYLAMTANARRFENYYSPRQIQTRRAGRSTWSAIGSSNSIVPATSSGRGTHSIISIHTGSATTRSIPIGIPEDSGITPTGPMEMASATMSATTQSSFLSAFRMQSSKCPGRQVRLNGSWGRILAGATSSNRNC